MDSAILPVKTKASVERTPPVELLLDLWVQKKGASYEQLKQALKDMGRNDVVQDLEKCRHLQ